MQRSTKTLDELSSYGTTEKSVNYRSISDLKYLYPVRSSQPERVEYFLYDQNYGELLKVCEKVSTPSEADMLKLIKNSLNYPITAIRLTPSRSNGSLT